MINLDFYDIDLEWHGEPPPERVAVERVVRSELRQYLPVDPADLPVFFIQHEMCIVLVCCQSAKAFLCTWFA